MRQSLRHLREKTAATISHIFPSLLKTEETTVRPESWMAQWTKTISGHPGSAPVGSSQIGFSEMRMLSSEAVAATTSMKGSAAEDPGSDFYKIFLLDLQNSQDKVYEGNGVLSRCRSDPSITAAEGRIDQLVFFLHCWDICACTILAWRYGIAESVPFYDLVLLDQDCAKYDQHVLINIKPPVGTTDEENLLAAYTALQKETMRILALGSFPAWATAKVFDIIWERAQDYKVKLADRQLEDLGRQEYLNRWLDTLTHGTGPGMSSDAA